MTRRCRFTGDRWKLRDFVWELYYWDLRTLNNAKPFFFLNEMNKKELPAIYSTAFWFLIVVLLVFWLYCITTFTPFIEWSEGWSLRSVGVWTSLNKNAVFFAEIQIHCKLFGSSPRGKLLLPLWEISSKKDPWFPIKSSHLCRTSKHVWLSSSACDPCCAYQLPYYRKLTLHEIYWKLTRLKLTRI